MLISDEESDTITCARKGCFVEIQEDDIGEDCYELVVFEERGEGALFCAECSVILRLEWENQMGSPLPDDYIDEDAEMLTITRIEEWL